MNVHNRIWESLKNDSSDDSHETGQNYKLNPVGAKKIHNGNIACLATGVGAMIENVGRDSVAFCSFQGKSIGFIADDADHLCLYGAVLYAINNGLEVGSVS